jgi:hypothetical protein
MLAFDWLGADPGDKKNDSNSSSNMESRRGFYNVSLFKPMRNSGYYM